MRLTKKSDRDYTGYEPVEELVKGNNASPIIGKLGQLEDIEEELGIELVTLFKALKNGIYEKFEDGEYVKFNGLCMPIKSHKLKLNVNKKCLERGNDYFYFKDYGKTWALTKEELKHE